MNEIKSHFEEEAEEFDTIILKLVPFYKEMIDALVSAIPFEKQRQISVLDVGSGTGNISKKVKETFPNSKITCLDFAQNMIEMAKIKLKEYDTITYVVEDFSAFEANKKYDVVISSLALHHLATDEDKKIFYKKTYNILSFGGVFYNADVVLGSNEYLERVNMAKWMEFMSKNITKEEMETNWIPKYRKEDRPARLMDHIRWMQESGFLHIDVIWKYYKGAVYGGYK